MRLIHPVSDEEPDLDALYAYPAGPWVRANMIASVDGSAVLHGGSRALANKTDRQLIGRLRGLADVVMVGAGTARAEGYGPLRPRPDRRRARQERGMAPVPRLAIVSASLDLDLDGPAFVDAELPSIVITHAATDPDRRRAVAAVADLVVTGADHVDMVGAVDALLTRGLSRILCEGGPSLLTALISAGRLDELCLTVSPMLVGSQVGLVADGVLPRPTQFQLGHALRDDDYLYLRYTCGDRSPGPEAPHAPP